MRSPRQLRQTGRFVYDVVADTWSWDDDVFRIHGHEPGSIEPTTDLILRSKHEADRDRVRAELEAAVRSGAPFSIYFRIRTVDGEPRRVVLVGEGRRDADGAVIELRGYYLDLTPDFNAETERSANLAVAASAESRAAIEQAKGALMLAYGLDADAAFAMLRWWSRSRGVKVRDIADGLLALVAEGNFTNAGLRRVLDDLLDDLTSEEVSSAHPV
ncbi:MAG TPA: PAS and ANTAR domain-containing protein [Nocardioides sp.]